MNKYSRINRRKILLIFILISIGGYLSGQNSFGLCVNAGTFISKNPTTKEAKAGADHSLGFLKSVYHEMLYLKPTINLKVVDFNSVQPNHSKESYVMLGLGTEALMRFGDFKKIQTFPFVKIAYCLTAMTLSDGIIVSSNGKAANENILRGGVPVFGFGAFGEARNFQLKLQYEIFRANISYKKALLSDKNTE